MKTRKSRESTATPSPKATVKIKSLKLTKETVENLSDADAGAIKGGAAGTRGDSEGSRPGYTSSTNHNEAFVCDES